MPSKLNVDRRYMGQLTFVFNKASVKEVVSKV